MGSLPSFLQDLFFLEKGSPRLIMQAQRFDPLTLGREDLDPWPGMEDSAFFPPFFLCFFFFFYCIEVLFFRKIFFCNVKVELLPLFFFLALNLLVILSVLALSRMNSVKHFFHPFPIEKIESLPPQMRTCEDSPCFSPYFGMPTPLK